jgi:hypothetical protein
MSSSTHMLSKSNVLQGYTFADQPLYYLLHERRKTLAFFYFDLEFSFMITSWRKHHFYQFWLFRNILNTVKRLVDKVFFLILFKIFFWRYNLKSGMFGFGSQKWSQYDWLYTVNLSLKLVRASENSRNKQWKIIL